MKIAIWIVISLVVLGGIGGGAAYWAARNSKNALAGIAVKVEPATLGDLVETTSAPGTIEAKTKVSISARISARIMELPFKEGDTVTKGDPTTKPAIPPSLLLKLDSTDLEADLRAAQARYAAQQAQLRVSKASADSQRSQVESAQVQLDDAQRDLRRQMELLNTHDVSQSVVDTAQAKVDQLRAELASAQHGLEGSLQNIEVLINQLEAADADIAHSKDNLSYTTITSPIDGVVTRVNAEVGELVVTGTMNNPGTVVLEVADLTKMLVKARVDESSIAQVKVGQKAVVHIAAYRDREFKGTVSSVALAETVETTMGNTRYFKAEILIDTDGDRIISGLNADVDIETAAYRNVITVPSQAVLGRPTDQLPQSVRDKPGVDKSKGTTLVVYRLIDGKAVVTPVTIGASDVTRTVVKTGISEGDQIVTGPFKTLETLADSTVIRSEGPLTKPTTHPTTAPTTNPSTNSSTQPTTAPAH